MTEDGPAVRVGDTGPRSVHLLFSELARPFEDDPTLDFVVKARGQWVSIETVVRTWHGDGLDTFLSSLPRISAAGKARAAGALWNAT
ncbi:hypothetical protein [Streptomyces adonidis]|uniref:hypothetical protein n=1 Tax=Streptomyces adonidis TaxID=3231367 RepID=UPI0034DB1B83